MAKVGGGASPELRTTLFSHGQCLRRPRRQTCARSLTRSFTTFDLNASVAGFNESRGHPLRAGTLANTPSLENWVLASASTCAAIITTERSRGAVSCGARTWRATCSSRRFWRRARRFWEQKPKPMDGGSVVASTRGFVFRGACVFHSCTRQRLALGNSEIREIRIRHAAQATSLQMLAM